MQELEKRDYTLIEKARKVIRQNYDGALHQVGAAVRCTDGTIYAGVNLESVHGACAEVIALGTALSSGAREFECIAAVGGPQSDQLLSPCGNCRQLLLDYAPNCQIIIMTPQGAKKCTPAELLPHPWQYNHYSKGKR